MPDEVKKDLTVIAVETVEDVLKETLGISLPRLEQVLMQKEGSGRLLEAFDSGKTNLRREVI